MQTGILPLVLLVLLGGSAIADWESTGPPGGPVTDLTQSPSSPLVLYLLGGYDPVKVMKSTDGGLTWSQASTIDGFASSIEASSNGSVFVAGLNHIWRSTNGGASWTSTVFPSADVRDIACNVLEPSRVIAIGDTTTGSWSDVMFYWSEDGGATWNDQPYLVSGSEFHGQGVAFSRTDPGYNYQCMYAPDISSRCHVFYSTWYGGYDISPSSTLCPFSIDGRPGATGTIIVGTGGGILRTTNLGATWNTATGASDIFYDVSYSPANSSYAFASSALSVYRSTDAGQSWTSSSSGLSGWTFLSAVPSCSDQNTVYTTSSAGFFRSTNAGVSWAPSNSGLLIGWSQALALPADQPQTVYQALTGMGVWKSIDNGTTWTQTTSPFVAGEICALAVNPDTGVEVFALESELYGQPRLYASTNGGTSWTNVDQHYASAGALCADPVNGGTYWTAGSVASGSVQRACVSRTTTSGPPWERDTLTANDSRLYSIAVAPSAVATVYAGGRELTSPAVYRTTNGGSTWTKMSATGLSGHVYALAVRADAPNTVFAGTPQGIFRSTNGGGTFTKVSTTIAGVQCIAADPSAPGMVYLGTESMGVFVSSDGGTTWTPLNAGLTNDCVNCLAIAPGLYVHAGTQGSAAFRYGLAVDVPGEETVPMPEAFLRCLPNPGSGEFTVLFELAGEGFVEIEVLDLAGRVVALPVEGWFGPGAHGASLNLGPGSGSPLPGGVYLLRLTSGSRSASTRIVLTR